MPEAEGQGERTPVVVREGDQGGMTPGHGRTVASAARARHRELQRRPAEAMRPHVRSRVGAATLLIVAAVFLAVGWIGITEPRVLLDPLGIQLPSDQALRVARATAMSEARATYGGMHLALGLLFLAGVVLARARGAALAVAFVYLAGLVAGRSTSVALDGSPAPVGWVLLAIEALGLLLVGGALWKRWRLAPRFLRSAHSAPTPAAPRPGEVPTARDPKAPGSGRTPAR